LLRSVALILTALTGFSGLVYEVCWQRYLTTLLGSDSEATATILGIYLGGLALGYRLFAWQTRTIAGRSGGGAPRSLLLLYGAAEATIGVLALLFPWSFAAVQRLAAVMPHAPPAVGFLSDVFLTALLIGPPTVLMGGTIPVLTQALARSLDDAMRVHALIYGFNTAGAFLGAAAAGFVLIPQLGLVGVVWSMGIINLLAGATFVMLGLGRSAGASGAVEATAADAEVPRFAAYAGVALLAGFAMMALQTVLIRLAGLALGSSHFTFSMVVSTFVLSIALGSFAVSAFRHIRPSAVVAVLWILVVALIAFYGRLDDAPYWAYRFRLLFGRSDADFYPYYLAAFGVFLGIFALPIGLAGALLPMLFGVLRQRFGELGDVAGRLYSWNTVGSLLGALLGGYALLLWLDLHHVYRITVAALVLGTVVLGWTLLPRHQALVNGIGGIAMIGTICLMAPWDPLRLSTGLFRQREALAEAAQGADAMADLARRGIDIAFYTDDPAASVAVWERKDGAPGLARSVRVNGKSEGEIPADYVTMSLVALLPALVAESCERSFVIGYGTGVTAGELATLECARRVEVAEISRGVLEAAPLFDYGNLGASLNPKVVLVAADAYRSLRRADARYDIIASEPSNPWVAGVEMLFSREFLELARQRLTSGGVFAQWIHLYEIDTSTLGLIFHTFASVFERVAVWHMLQGDIVLLGMGGDAVLDLEQLERRFDRPDFRIAFARAGVPDFVSLLAREIYPLGVVNGVSWTDPVHTLLRPVLNHQAARAFFRGDRGQLPALVQHAAATIGREQSLLRRYAARYGGSLPEGLHRRAVEETCEYSLKLCVTLMAEWSARDPGSPALVDLLERHLQLSQSEHARSILRGLVALFGAGAGAEPTAGSVKAAEDASGLFVAYYHHAAPFAREALLSEWQRCPGGLAPGSACLAGLEEVERHLGSLRN